MNKKKTSVLLIYTGGTIGMLEDPESGELRPFDFNSLSDNIPELRRLDVRLKSFAFKKPLDSSDMQPRIWVELAQLIYRQYSRYNGFVILHGSDTMSFTASALSFMLENLGKPVVLTGSQLPIGVIRTDGKENLITAIEIASAVKKGKPLVPEVCIYFEYKLYRGNRTVKYNSSHFDAFRSPNYPLLGEAGINISFNESAVLKPVTKRNLKIHTKLDNNIAVLKLYPGISENSVKSVLGTPGLKALVMETFGAGNASTAAWFVNLLKEAVSSGILVLNITQCPEGRVILGMYATSSKLKKIGVTGGSDLTFEGAVTKLMFLLGQGHTGKKLKKLLLTDLRGEMSA